MKTRVLTKAPFAVVLGLLVVTQLCWGRINLEKIVISPNGPIKSMAEARDAARAQRRSGKVGPIVITVRAGTYYLPETLILGPEDSDTIWEAPHGEHPIISGGRVISGWTKTGDHVWKADAPGPYFHQLFVGGRRATRARSPNSGFFRIDGKSSQAKPFELHYRDNEIKKEWAKQGDVEVVAYLAWSDLRMPIVKVDETAHLATLGSNPRESNKEDDARYFIENAPDALDAPGEWYLDKTKHIVSYIPVAGENMERTLAVAPTLERLVSVEGRPESGALVRNVVFRGLTFADADWSMDSGGYADKQAATPAPAAIEVTGTENFKMEKCTITRSGGYALYLGRGTKHSQIVANEFFDLGAGGVKVGESVLRTNDADQNYANVIADNNIHDLGLVYAAGVGIWVLQSGRNQIVHNHVHDLFYTAISVGWTWGYGLNQSKGNLIAFNDIHGVGKNMLSDLGGIYTLGEQPGTIIRNNLVHDISSFTYGGWGLYADEGSSDIVFENNIVYDCKSAGFHQHYGRDNIVRNNIFAFNREFQLARTRAEPHNSFTFEHNIVYFNQGNLLSGNWGGDEKENYRTFFQASGSDSAQPAHFIMRDNLYYDTRGLGISFAGRSFSEWQSSGQDRGSLITDPLFVNAGNFDFRLRPDSPALMGGFHQIDMTTVGPRVRTGADAW